MLTFGSALGPALLGHFMKRDVRDIQYFTGRLKPIHERNKTASKISKTPGGEMDLNANSVLRKMYTLMANTHEENVKRRELAKNREEENQLEDERRHKELLSALSSLGGTTTVIKKEEPKEEDFGGIFGSMLKYLKDWMEGLVAGMIKKAIETAMKAFKWLEDVGTWAKQLLQMVSWEEMLTAIARSLPALAFLAPWMAAADEREKIRQNPFAPEYKDNPFAMSLRNEAKNEGQAAELNTRKSQGRKVLRGEIADAVKSDYNDNELRNLYGADRSALQKWLNEHTNRADQWQIGTASLQGSEFGKTESGSVTPIDKTAQTRIANESRATFAKTDPRMELAGTTLSDKLNSTVDENLKGKVTVGIMQKTPPATEVNNTNVNQQLDKTTPVKRPMPSVRNQEEEFQNRTFSNTRVAN
jgi:hypothetical protein